MHKQSFNLPLLGEVGHAHLPDTHRNSTTCERCSRFDESIAEQANVSERLRANNENLKVRIEMLSQVIAEKIDQFKSMKNTVAAAPVKVDKQQCKCNLILPCRLSQFRYTVVFLEDSVRRELEEEYKKLEQLTKSLKNVETKWQSNQNVYRMAKVRDQIEEKRKELQRIRLENRHMEDIRIHHETILADIDDYQEIKDLSEEVIGLKALLNDTRKRDQQMAKNMVKQCAQIVAVEKKHKEVCEKFGISPSLNQTRFDNLQDLISDNLRNKQIREKREENQRVSKTGKIQVTEASYRQIYSELKDKKEEKLSMEIAQKNHSEELQQIVRESTLERDSLMLRLRDKEKELNIAIMRLNELKRLTKHNALLPLRVRSDSALRNNPSDFSPIIGKKLVNDLRREQHGVTVGSATACFWDQSSELPEERDYSIGEIRVLHSDEQIKGITVEYRLKNGSRVELESFAPASRVGCVEKVLKLRANESIASISGLYNNFFIEYLRIVSTRGSYIMIGSDRNSSRCKRFECEIKKDERPIAFFGIVDKISLNKKGGNNNNTMRNSYQQYSDVEENSDMVLTSFGAVLKKRDAMHVNTSLTETISAKNKNNNLSTLDNLEENQLYSTDLVRERHSVTNRTVSKKKLIDAVQSRINQLHHIAIDPIPNKVSSRISLSRPLSSRNSTRAGHMGSQFSSNQDY